MKKAVIFDLDGTLADTLESIQYCANYAIGTCGYPEIPLEKHCHCFDKRRGTSKSSVRPRQTGWKSPPRLPPGTVSPL